jgi:pimeloyl-ACP methyl ester carboxylesterase
MDWVPFWLVMPSLHERIGGRFCETIDIPTLVIHGDDDPIVLPLTPRCGLDGGGQADWYGQLHRGVGQCAI